ncbi:hypothetical protein SpCBS45565_g05470 [Spizellomyces sp. 'palustris']|nr:hypothetical protein SpCBS45565_g05470 [Spizellomyces sp. 'palustris']
METPDWDWDVEENQNLEVGTDTPISHSKKDPAPRWAGYIFGNEETTASSSNSSRTTTQHPTYHPSLSQPKNRSQPRPHSCPHCSRTFTRRFNLSIHMETHNPHRIKAYKCPLESCPKAFHRMPDLVRHRKMVHRERLERWRDGCEKMIKKEGRHGGESRLGCG